LDHFRASSASGAKMKYFSVLQKMAMNYWDIEGLRQELPGA
jgi:hypothetical protein